MLNTGDFERYFSSGIVPLTTAFHESHPFHVYVISEPGVPGDAVRARITEGLGRETTVNLGRRDLLIAHPHYDRLALHDDRTAPAQVADDIREAEHKALRLITRPPGNGEIRSNFVTDMASTEAMKRSIESDVYVEAVFVASHISWSLLKSLESYQKDHRELGYGSWVDLSAHIAAYTETSIGLANAIDDHFLADGVRIVVPNQNGPKIRHSNVVIDGSRQMPSGPRWEKASRTAQFLTTTRLDHAVRSPGQITSFISRVRRLADRGLPQALLPALAYAVDAAAEAQNEQADRLETRDVDAIDAAPRLRDRAAQYRQLHDRLRGVAGSLRRRHTTFTGARYSSVNFRRAHTRPSIYAVPAVPAQTVKESRRI